MSEKPSTMRSLLISTCQLGKNHLLHNGGQQSNINIVLLLFSFFTAIEQQRLKPQHIFKVTAFCLKRIFKKKSLFKHLKQCLLLLSATLELPFSWNKQVKYKKNIQNTISRLGEGHRTMIMKRRR